MDKLNTGFREALFPFFGGGLLMAPVGEDETKGVQ